MMETCRYACAAFPNCGCDVEALRCPHDPCCGEPDACNPDRQQIIIPPNTGKENPMNEIVEHDGEYVAPQWQVDVHGNRIVEFYGNPLEDPEIPVTEHMSEAGERAYALAPNDQHIALASAYRAMAALAPLKFDHTMMLLARTDRAIAQQHITALEADLTKAKASPNPRNVPYDVYDRALSEILTGNEGIEARDQRIAILEAENGNLRDKFNRKSEAAMRESDDKNATIARLRVENSALEANCLALGDEVAELCQEVVRLKVYYTGVASPGDVLPVGPPSSDLPDPPRRSDGTLAPQPKPWTPPKASGDSRRIGG